MTFLSMCWRFLRCVALAWLLAAPAWGQEFRATITGQVTDPAGLAMPGVTIAALNVQTNEVASTVSSAEGVYSLPFLKPGLYTVTAELEGFRKHTQDQVQLEVGRTVTINIALQIGLLTETVTVSGESPLESAKADRGMVIDNLRVTELPLNARNPFMLSYLSPGITYNGPAIYQRPFDNGAIADWSINGGQNRNNEFLLDGAPNNSIQGGNNIAYVPPVDAVQEFKIVTNSYDAQYGRTAGGVINVSLKSGTNDLHGTVYEFARRKAFDSNEYFFKLNNREKPDHKLDQYGFQIDGPVTIPGLYDGRNKTFFMFNFEGYNEATPNPATYTVPDAAQLRGDFSNLRDAQGRLITIYDPSTGRNVNGVWTRDPFPNNQIPSNRINPMAQQFLQYFLQPNTAPPAGTDPWRNNFVFAPNLAFDDFHNYATKVDQVLSDKTRMFVRYAYNKRTETRYTNGITTGPAQDGQLPLERKNHTGVADWVRTVSSSLVLNVRAGLNQYLELARSDPGLNFNPSELGFPSSLVSQLPNQVFPRVNFNTTGTTTEYQGLGRASRNSETTTGFSFQPNFSWLKGKHSVRGGLDMRMTWYTREINNNLFVMTFDRRFTQRAFDQPNDALSGNSIASFLLGAAASGSIDNNFYPTLRWNYYAPWIQDDWQLTNRLTVNLGFRWDLNSPVFEEDNQLNYNFDTQAINPVSARLPGGMQVRGGLGFVDVNGNPRYPYQVRQEQHPAADGPRLHAERRDRAARRLRPVLSQRRRHLGVRRVQRDDAAHHVARRRPDVDLPADESVLSGDRAGAGLVARPGDAPGTRSELLEHRVREPLRSSVLGLAAADAPLAHHDRGGLRGQPHAPGAEPLGRVQRAAARAAEPVRPVSGRESRHLQPAAAEPVLPGAGLRGHAAIHEPDAHALRAEPSVPAVHEHYPVRPERRDGLVQLGAGLREQAAVGRPHAGWNVHAVQDDRRERRREPDRRNSDDQPADRRDRSHRPEVGV